MREVTYNPSKFFMDIVNTGRHDYTIHSRFKIPVVAISLNDAGETLYLYEKKSREGSYMVMFERYPIVILKEGLTYETLVANRRHYRWVNEKDCIKSQGNKGYKDKLRKL